MVSSPVVRVNPLARSDVAAAALPSGIAPMHVADIEFSLISGFGPSPATVDLDLGIRAARIPLPYAIYLRIVDIEGPIRPIEARLERLLEGPQSIFLAAIDNGTSSSFACVSSSPSEEQNSKSKYSVSDNHIYAFWAAPDAFAPNGSGQLVLSVTDDEYRDYEIHINVSVCSTKPRISVVAPSYPSRETRAETNILFDEHNHESDALITVWNETDGDAPLLLNIVLEEDASGAFLIGENSEQDTKCITVLLQANSSHSFPVRFRMRSDLTLLHFYYGSVLVKYAFVVQAQTPPGQDLELHQYYDHVLNLKASVANIDSTIASSSTDSVTAEATRLATHSDDECVCSDGGDHPLQPCSVLLGSNSIGKEEKSPRDYGGPTVKFIDQSQFNTGYGSGVHSNGKFYQCKAGEMSTTDPQSDYVVSIGCGNNVIVTNNVDVSRNLFGIKGNADEQEAQLGIVNVFPKSEAPDQIMGSNYRSINADQQLSCKFNWAKELTEDSSLLSKVSNFTSPSAKEQEPEVSLLARSTTPHYDVTPNDHGCGTVSCGEDHVVVLGSGRHLEHGAEIENSPKGEDNAWFRGDAFSCQDHLKSIEEIDRLPKDQDVQREGDADSKQADVANASGNTCAGQPGCCGDIKSTTARLYRQRTNDYSPNNSAWDQAANESFADGTEGVHRSNIAEGQENEEPADNRSQGDDVAMVGALNGLPHASAKTESNKDYEDFHENKDQSLQIEANIIPGNVSHHDSRDCLDLTNRESDQGRLASVGHSRVGEDCKEHEYVGALSHVDHCALIKIDIGSDRPDQFDERKHFSDRNNLDGQDQFHEHDPHVSLDERHMKEQKGEPHSTADGEITDVPHIIGKSADDNNLNTLSIRSHSPTPTPSTDNGDILDEHMEQRAGEITGCAKLARQELPQYSELEMENTRKYGRSTQTNYEESTSHPHNSGMSPLGKVTDQNIAVEALAALRFGHNTSFVSGDIAVVSKSGFIESRRTSLWKGPFWTGEWKAEDTAGSDGPEQAKTESTSEAPFDSSREVYQPPTIRDEDRNGASSLPRNDTTCTLQTNSGRLGSLLVVGRPKLKMPRRIREKGVVMNASQGSLELPLMNASAEVVELSVTVENVGDNGDEIGTMVTPNYLVIGAGEKARLTMVRTSSLGGENLVVLRAATMGTHPARVNYRVPAHVAESVMRVEASTEFSVDRPTMSFYNPGEKTREWCVRLRNGTDRATRYRMWIGEGCGTLHKSNGEPAFKIIGPATGIIQPERFASLRVAFNGGDVVQHFHGRLNLHVGEQRDFMPLFGYSGASDVRLFPTELGYVCARNNGTRSGFIVITGPEINAADCVSVKAVLAPGEEREFVAPYGTGSVIYVGDEIARSRQRRAEELRHVSQEDTNDGEEDSSRLFGGDFDGEDTANDTEGFDWWAEDKFSLFYSGRLLDHNTKRYVFNLNDSERPMFVATTSTSQSGWTATVNEGFVHIENLEVAKEVSFEVDGAEPRCGVIAPLGDAMLAAFRESVEIRGLGRTETLHVDLPKKH